MSKNTSIQTAKNVFLVHLYNSLNNNTLLIKLNPDWSWAFSHSSVNLFIRSSEFTFLVILFSKRLTSIAHGKYKITNAFWNFSFKLCNHVSVDALVIELLRVFYRCDNIRINFQWIILKCWILECLKIMILDLTLYLFIFWFNSLYKSILLKSGFNFRCLSKQWNLYSLDTSCNLWRFHKKLKVA